MSCYWVRLGGAMPATEIAEHTPPTWETLADGGIGEVSLTFALDSQVVHPLLATGTLVEVFYGAEAVATAQVTEYDRNTGALAGYGLSAHANKLLALSGTGAPTRDLFQAITTAQAWGWPAQNPNLAGGLASGAADAPVFLGELFTQRAAEHGFRWGVDGRGDIYLRADPGIPTYMIMPGAAAFGTTDEGAASHLVGTYRDVTSDTLQTLIWPPSGTPRAHEVVDLSESGPMSVTEAGRILGGLLSLDSVTGWTNGVELGPEQITLNGVPADLALVTAGQMARATGFSADLADAPWLDVVIGKTRYTAGADVIYLEPTNKAPRTFVEVQSA